MNIGIEPLVLELVTSLLFGLFAWKFGLDWALPAYCVLAVGLVGLSWIDLRPSASRDRSSTSRRRIGVPLLCLAAIVNDEPERIWMMLLGAGIALAFMGIVYVASRGGMGDGDVRLSPLLGAYLGWLNPGLVAGRVVLRVPRRRGRRCGRDGRRPRRSEDAVPFGPFLAARHDRRRLHRSAVHRPIHAPLNVRSRPSSAPSTPYMAYTSATATKPTITPTKMIMIGSNIVVNFLIRLSSSRSK